MIVIDKFIDKTSEEKIQTLACSCVILGWIEIIQCNSKTSFHVAKKVASHWIYCYPRPTCVIYYNGGGFTECGFQELLICYAITPVPTTIKNPQANDFVERVHVTMGDILHNKAFILDTKNTWRNKVDNVLLRVARVTQK